LIAMSELTGLIIKSTGGFYYVEASGHTYECRARGILRKQEITPLVGDRCVISVPDNGMPMVDSIAERKNSLIRPAVANIDKLFIVISACRPTPNPLITDRLTAAAEYADIEPIIVTTKVDIADSSAIEEIYCKAGYKVIRADYSNSKCIEDIKKELSGCISAFAGNSGVGKSTLLNAIEPELQLKTSDISEKLGRGRHTTRTVELYSLSCGGKIADTPGFSSFDGKLGFTIDKEKLPFCFREFENYIDDCRFTSCTHLCEKGCAVIDAVKRGEIAPSRHENYSIMYGEAQNIKSWETKN